MKGEGEGVGASSPLSVQRRHAEALPAPSDVVLRLTSSRANSSVTLSPAGITSAPIADTARRGCREGSTPTPAGALPSAVLLRWSMRGLSDKALLQVLSQPLGSPVGSLLPDSSVANPALPLLLLQYAAGTDLKRTVGLLLPEPGVLLPSCWHGSAWCARHDWRSGRWISVRIATRVLL